MSKTRIWKGRLIARRDGEDTAPTKFARVRVNLHERQRRQFVRKGSGTQRLLSLLLNRYGLHPLVYTSYNIIYLF